IYLRLAHHARVRNQPCWRFVTRIIWFSRPDPRRSQGNSSRQQQIWTWYPAPFERTPSPQAMGITMRQTLHLADLAATQQFAMAVARLLGPGDVILLTGDLGAGKITFTQGLAHGLGIEAHITSPTFVLARHHEHPGNGLNLVHVDAYRLTNKDELTSLDLETSL